jgi:hypothetical protein
MHEYPRGGIPKVIHMANTNFRKRRREVSRFSMELLPLDVFPADAIMTEDQGRRLSDILIDFASPLISGIDKENFFQFKTMIYFAAVAWNFSYFDKGEQRKMALDRFLLNSELFNEGNKGKMYNIVDSLSARKKSVFWQYDFFIAYFDLIKGARETTLMASAVPYSLIDISAAFGKIN